MGAGRGGGGVRVVLNLRATGKKMVPIIAHSLAVIELILGWISLPSRVVVLFCPRFGSIYCPCFYSVFCSCFFSVIVRVVVSLSLSVLLFLCHCPCFFLCHCPCCCFSVLVGAVCFVIVRFVSLFLSVVLFYCCLFHYSFGDLLFDFWLI